LPWFRRNGRGICAATTPSTPSPTGWTPSCRPDYRCSTPTACMPSRAARGACRLIRAFRPYGDSASVCRWQRLQASPSLASCSSPPLCFRAMRVPAPVDRSLRSSRSVFRCGHHALVECHPVSHPSQGPQGRSLVKDLRGEAATCPNRWLLAGCRTDARLVGYSGDGTHTTGTGYPRLARCSRNCRMRGSVASPHLHLTTLYAWPRGLLQCDAASVGIQTARGVLKVDLTRAKYVEPRGLEPLTPCLQSGGAGLVERRSCVASREWAHPSSPGRAFAAAVSCCRFTTNRIGLRSAAGPFSFSCNRNQNSTTAQASGTKSLLRGHC
jgi:hypothetical protein